jgi:3-phenylpropionate/cinnamic acid dioxygenase small subunit
MDLNDRQAIIDLISQYSYSYDGNDMKTFMSLFDKDAIFSIAGNEISAEEFFKVAAMGANMHVQEGIQTRHYQTNTVITDIGERKVRAKTMLLVVYQHPDKPAPDKVNSGIYEDEFRKTEQGWKFLRRTLQLDHP